VKGGSRGLFIRGRGEETERLKNILTDEGKQKKGRNFDDLRGGGRERGREGEREGGAVGDVIVRPSHPTFTGRSAAENMFLEILSENKVKRKDENVGEGGREGGMDEGREGGTGVRLGKFQT
jgi:hypothetical protein